MIYDVIIIGAGPAGMTSAIYTKRSGLNVLVIEQGMPGGQAATTHAIENYPGFKEPISGPDLMLNFFEQMMSFGVEMVTKRVEKINISEPVKEVVTSDATYQAKALILASGAQPRLLGAEGEGKYRGKGVSYCATCDGFFFKDKDVVVVGGGDSALEESLYLSKICKSVTIIHRRETFRGAKILQDRVYAAENITVMMDYMVEEIAGTEDKVTALQIKHVNTEEASSLATDGVFIFVGYLPNADYIVPENGLLQDGLGYIGTDETLMTDQPGVFVAGDLRVKTLRQVTTAVGDGALVNVAVERYLSEVN